jgi:predicted transcriptional regulator
MPSRLRHRVRSKFEIISSILNSTRGYKGATISQIQYDMFISYKQLKDYLALLVQHKLIEYVREEKKFRITENGINALNMFDEMNKLIAREAVNSIR